MCADTSETRIPWENTKKLICALKNILTNMNSSHRKTRDKTDLLLIFIIHYGIHIYYITLKYFNTILMTFYIMIFWHLRGRSTWMRPGRMCAETKRLYNVNSDNTILTPSSWYTWHKRNLENIFLGGERVAVTIIFPPSKFVWSYPLYPLYT